MKTIVLISGTVAQENFKTKAKNLYTGVTFKLSLELAYKMKPDEIYILSPRYHLLALETEVEPYNIVLYHSPRDTRKYPQRQGLTKNELYDWSKTVIEQLSKLADLKNDKFIFMGSPLCYKQISPNITNLSNHLKTDKNSGVRIHKIKELLKQ